MHALVFLWQPETASVPSSIPGHDFVVAADSGLEVAARWGVAVIVAIGDFDSVDGVVLEQAEQRGTVIQRRPHAKDQTDGELAIDLAVSSGATALTIFASAAGRLDQALAVIGGLARPELASVAVSAVLDDDVVTVIRDTATFSGRPGGVLSLIPLHGDAVGVRTEGLQYPLHGETLFAGSSRGVSNEFVTSEATVSVKSGILLAIQPR